MSAIDRMLKILYRSLFRLPVSSCLSRFTHAYLLIVLLPALVLNVTAFCHAECISRDGKVSDYVFLKCVNQGGTYKGSTDYEAFKRFFGRWDVDCQEHVWPTQLAPNDDNNEIIELKRVGNRYHINLHYKPDNSYYNWVVFFVDFYTAATYYKARSQDGKITEWVVDGIDRRTRLPAKNLTRCNQTYLCFVSSMGGETVRVDKYGLTSYFSAGDSWPVSIDLENRSAIVSSRTDARGNTVSITEQYVTNTTPENFSLKSTGNLFGLPLLGPLSLDSTAIEIDRKNNEFHRMQRVKDTNSGSPTYKDYNEYGKCSPLMESELDKQQ